MTDVSAEIRSWATFQLKFDSGPPKAEEEHIIPFARVLTLSMLLCMGGVSVAAAQDAAEAREKDVLAALDSLAPRARVLLSIREEGRREAVLLGLREDSLEVLFPGQRRRSSIALLQLDSAWLPVRTPRRTWVGAAAGAAAGVALVGAAAAYACRLTDASCGGRAVATTALLGGAGGAAAGALAGRFVDYVWPRWHLLFPVGGTDRPRP